MPIYIKSGPVQAEVLGNSPSLCQTESRVMILPIRISAPSTGDGTAATSLIATVDTSTSYLHLTPEIAGQLGLQQIDTRSVRDAEGQHALCPYVGPVLVEARGIKAYMGAVVCGTEVILGRAALAALGLVADDLHGKVYTDNVTTKQPVRTI